MKHAFVISILLFGYVTLSAQTAEIFQTEKGAIKGYDPVSFFKNGKAVLGKEDFTHEWKGAIWHFDSKENLDAFKQEPEKYAPQYGGYCAYGMADGHKAPTETETWTIVNDKLYFNYNRKVQTEWKKNQPELIKKADTNWPTLKNKE